MFNHKSPLKIAYYSCTRLPSYSANSIHTIKMANALSNHAEQVRLYSFCNQNTQTKSIYDFYGIKESRLCLIKKPIIFDKRWISHLASLYFILDCVLFRPAFIISRDPSAVFFATILGFKSFFEIHAPIETMGSLSRFMFHVFKKSRLFIGLIVVTSSLKQDFVDKSHLQESRIFVLPDAADDLSGPIIPPPEIYQHLNKYEYNIGYVGSLFKGKGIEVVLQLANKMPHVNFHVVGGTSPQINNWLQTCNSELNNLCFLGHYPPSQIPGILHSMTALLLPNQEKVLVANDKDIGRFTSPLKMFEYMRSLKPIVSSDLPVLREVLKHGFNAHLCNPRDINKWIDGINKVIDDQGYARMISKQAYIDFKNHYTWSSRANSLINIFLHCP